MPEADKEDKGKKTYSETELAPGLPITKAECHKLIQHANMLRAILHEFRFFKQQMPRIASDFARMNSDLGVEPGEAPSDLGEAMPSFLTYELMGRTFFEIVNERYSSTEKVLQLISKLGVNTIPAKIILLSVMRDAIKQVSPRVYRSLQHRDDLYTAIIAALEELEDKLEEQAEEEDEEEEAKG